MEIGDDLPVDKYYQFRVVSREPLVFRKRCVWCDEVFEVSPYPLSVCGACANSSRAGVYRWAWNPVVKFFRRLFNLYEPF
jgi:hypothetical protein